MRVLLVEDDRELRSVLVELLVDADCEVVEAENAAAAAPLVDGLEAFDALVTDIHMPGRLNGLDLGRRFRARHTPNPIVYMTGRIEAMRGIRLRADREALLRKPYGLSALVATAQAMVAQSKQNRGRKLWPFLRHALGSREQDGQARVQS